MLKKKRYAVLVLIPVFIVLIILSPFLLSSTSTLHFVVSKVNKRISGRLSVESWLIGWQQGVLCRNVTYSNSEKGISVSIPTLTSNRGLLELVLAPRNLGMVHVENPVVELSGSAVQTFFSKAGAAESDKEGNVRLSEEAPPFWDQLYFELQSREGQVRAEWSDHDVAVAIKDLSIDGSLAAGVATFDVSFQTRGQGIVKAFGSLNLPAHEYNLLETIVAESEIKVSSLPLTDLMETVSSLSAFPQGEGEMNADFQFKTVGFGGIEVNGLAEVTDVTFNGGFLDGDQPAFRKLHVTVNDGKWEGDAWSVKEFELISDTLNMKVSGERSAEKTQLQAQGSLLLPVLFDQFPRLFHIHESTFVETGVLDFSADMSSTTPNGAMKLKAKANNIGGIFRGQRFSWDSQVFFLFNGERKGREVAVNALQFDAPFARVKGSGGPHNFTMDGFLDVDKALNDLGSLFQLDTTGSGKMELSVKSKSLEKEEDRFRADADITIDDFMLRYQDETVVPIHELSLLGSLKAPNSFWGQEKGELDLQVALSSWLGEIFLVVNGEKSREKPFKGYFTTDSELDLAQINRLPHIFDFLGNEIRMSGNLQLQAEGFTGGSSLEIRDLSAEATDFTLDRNDTHFLESRLKVRSTQSVDEAVSFLSLRQLNLAESKDAFFRNGGGLNLIDFRTRRICLHEVAVEAESGTANIDRLMIPDWRKPSDGARLQLALSGDLAKMTSGLHVLGLLPIDTSFSGSSKLSVNWTGKEESTQKADMELQVADFGLKRWNKIYIDSDDLVFAGRIHGNIPFGEMMVDELKLQSKTLNFMATGKATVDAEFQLLELSGSIKPDLEQFGSILGNEFGIDLQMAGQPVEQFVFRYPLWKRLGENPASLGVSSSFHADRFVYNGIEFREVVLPFHVADSTLYTEFTSVLNDGRFEFVANTDFNIDQAVMKTSGSSQIMTGVKLDDQLVSTLFSRFHPLFGGMAKPSGPIDVQLDSFWWPFGRGRESEANFVAIFDVREVRFQSRAKFKEILKSLGLEKESFKLQDNEIYCIGKNGRIKCSPVHIQTDEYEISMGGFVNLDKSLDYEMELPVTKNLVDNEVYQVLGGTKIKIALKGTSEDPSCDLEAVTSKIESLKKQAADEIVKKNKSRENT